MGDSVSPEFRNERLVFVPEAVATDPRFFRPKHVAAALAFAALPFLVPSGIAIAQGPPGGGSVSVPAGPIQIPQPPVDSTTYQSSVSDGKVTPGVLQLSLDDAVQRGLRFNLGLMLTSQNTQSARGARLEELQALLPTASAAIKEAVQETDLQAEGLRIPGFPSIIGPYGYTDIRGSLSWSLVNLSSLENYLAQKHNFEAAKLSAQDARDLVVLTVGNAYLTVIADAALVQSAQAQVDTSKVSLDQAVGNHQAGTAPLFV